MNIDHASIWRAAARPADVEIHAATIATVAALLLSACAANVTDPRTPEQVVAQTSGRSMAANDTVTPGSGFGLDGLAYVLSPLTQKCHQQQALMLTGRKRQVIFQDRRKESRPASLALTEIVICSQDSTPLWGANVELIDPEFLVAKSIGSGINYYAKVRATFVSAETIIANREAAERNRVAVEAVKRQNTEDQLVQLEQCRRRQEESSKNVQANPKVGMKVAYGLIVEVKHPLALIQYDQRGQALRGRQQEWVPVSTLRAGEDCPQ